VERKRLHGLGAEARSGAGLKRGIYTAEETERTYQRLADLVGAGLTAGYPILIDATCLKRSQRDRFHRLAAEAGAPFIIVSCTAPEAVLRERVASRERQQSDASEAGLAVLEQQYQTQDALADEELALTIAVDTRRDGDSFDQATAQLALRLGLTVPPT
jgi:hypothetical protein